MADDVTAPGTGAKFATDDIGGTHYPRGKHGFGADGEYSDVSDASPLPVAQTGVATEAKQDASISATGKLGSAKSWYAITPDGNADLNPIPDAIMCTGAAGNVVLKGSDGNTVTFPISAGQILPLSPTRVVATGTTAGGLIALIA